MAALDKQAATPTPENEQRFWAQYEAAREECKPTKPEIKQLLKDQSQMHLWPEVDGILTAHKLWI